MKNNNKGFTLIELLVVIAIIGLLSTLAVVSLNGARVKARNARRMSDLKQISTAMELYSSENGAYPAAGVCGANGVISTVSGAALCSEGYAIRDASNVYIASIPQTPSGSAYTWTGDDTTYCLEATIEPAATADPFICKDGSCYSDTSGTGC